MALGDYNNKSNNSNNYSPTVYGPIFSNPESELDATSISISYWKSTIRISIAAKSGENEYDRDNAISIYLNHTKARILSMILRDLIDNPEKYQNGHNRGVETVQGILTVSDGSDFGKPGHPCIVIRKITDDGVVTACNAYEFKREWYHTIDNYDQNEKDKYTVNSDGFENLEIEEFITILEEYYKAMTYGTAFTVAHAMNYCGISNILSNQYKIAGKLGVELSGNRSGSNRSGGYFNNNKSNNYHNDNNSSSSGSTGITIDDLANM